MAALMTSAGRKVTAMRCDDDFADRLNFRFTVIILLFCAALVFGNVQKRKLKRLPRLVQILFAPKMKHIECWSPAHFSREHRKYTNDHCYISSTYYLPYDQNIPPDGPGRQNRTILAERGGRTINYYPWIAFLLTAQALFFYLPCYVWHIFGYHSGVDVENVTESGMMIATLQMDTSVRKRILRKMVFQIDRYLSSSVGLRDSRCKAGGCNTIIKRLLTETCRFKCGRRNGNFIILLYLLTKVLYLLNIVGQVFLLNLVLGIDYHLFGIEMLSALVTGDDSATSHQFPLVVWCNLNVRRFGNVHRYTVQCTLPFNLLYEKIYLFLWFWMAYVALQTFVSLVAWVLRMAMRRDRHRYVRRYLNLAGKVKLSDIEDKKRMIEFTGKYLRQDGVFLLRMVSAAGNALAAVDLTGALWTNYWKNRPQTDETTENGPLLDYSRRPLLEADDVSGNKSNGYITKTAV